MDKYYFLIQTPRGVALAVRWLTDIATGAPNLSQIDEVEWVDESIGYIDRTYDMARSRWQHLLGK